MPIPNIYFNQPAIISYQFKHRFPVALYHMHMNRFMLIGVKEKYESEVLKYFGHGKLNSFPQR